MNLQWILLAFFLAHMIWEIFMALTRPMHRNVLNLISIPVAFLIAFTLQVMGLFQAGANWLLGLVELESYVGPELSEFAAAYLSTILSPALFVLVYWIIIWLVRLIHVNLISKFIENRQIKKEKRLLKMAIKEEKVLVKELVRANEEEAMALRETLEQNGFNPDLMDDYDILDEDDIEDMVEDRVKREKRAIKRLGWFKESKEKKSVSIIAGAVSGFLAFAIAFMPVFYTMGVLSDITKSIDHEHPEDNYNKIYLAIDFVDDNLVIPYESSFVYQIYDSMGLVDLMNGTVMLGGQLIVDGEVQYADTIGRDVLTNTIKVVTQVMSNNPNPEVLRNALNGIITEPLLFSFIYDAIEKIMADQEVPDDYDESDILSTIKYQIIANYKAPTEPTMPTQDMFATEEEYQAALLQYEKDLADYTAKAAAYKEMLTGDIEALTDVIVTLVEKKLIADLISGANDFDALLSDKDNIKDLLGTMSGLSVYNVVMTGAFDSGINMIGPMLGVPADKQAGTDAFISQIINASNNVSDMSAEDLASLKTLFINAASATYADNNTLPAGSILAYVADPLYSAEKIKDELKELKDQFDSYDALATELKGLQDKLASGTSLTAEEQARLTELLEMQDELGSLASKADEFSALVETKADEVEGFISQFEDRLKGFTPFVNYFLNWMNVQKPFMLSGVDTTNAPLSIIAGGSVYVCNTDSLSIDTLLDFALGDDSTEGDSTKGGSTEGGSTEGGSDSVDDLLNTKVDDFLDKIPMRSLLESLTIKEKTEDDGVELSPVADLINFLIEKYADSTTGNMSHENFTTVLSGFVAMNAENDSYSETLAASLISGEFEYNGVTVEEMKSSMKFGDDWTEELKKNDSEKLVDIIFTIIDLMGGLGGSEEEVAVASEDELGAMMDMLSILGKTLDIMADTYCLEELPQLMLEGLLKNEMLSTVMTPTMLNDYMSQMEAEDFSYETFMNDLVEKFTGLLDKVNGEGGIEG